MELSLHTFRELAGLIRHESGMVLGQDKSYLVRHRLEPLIRDRGLEDYDDLIKRMRMRTGAGLRSAVIDAITVKETRFFRDQSCFDGLREEVFPACASAIENSGKTRRRVRIWSAAAATGQEAYSLAMLVREFVVTNAHSLEESQFSILASDISPSAIESAKAGRFTHSEVHRGLSESRLSEHFHQKGERWHVNEPIRRLVQFRTFNLLHSPAELGAFDLILCRNVLIYFDDATRRKICRGLFSVLQAGGWLALGSAESLYGMEEHFETFVDARAILYRKPLRAP